MPSKWYSPVVWPINVAAPLPRELLPGFVLRKATAQECEKIVEAVGGAGGVLGRLHEVPDARVIFDPTVMDAYRKGVRPPEGVNESAFYYVIDVPGKGDRPELDGRDAIGQASVLLEFALELPVFIQPSGYAMTPPVHMSRFAMMDKVLSGNRDQVTGDYLDRLCELAAHVRGLGSAGHERIARSMQLYKQLNSVLQPQRLRHLGLFTVLECVLCSDPEVTKHPISQQLPSKIRFIDNRGTPCADYAVFPSKPPRERVWKSLYGYRSKLAHGGHVDFSETPLKVLQSIGHVDQFMEQAARGILRYALCNQDVMEDLASI